MLVLLTMHIRMIRNAWMWTFQRKIFDFEYSFIKRAFDSFTSLNYDKNEQSLLLSEDRSHRAVS